MQSVFEREHFALLRNTNASIDRLWWLTKNSLVNGTTTASNCSTTSMKHGNANAKLSPQPSHTLLCFVQFPARGQDATIFATIRIAKHHLLLVMALVEITLIIGVSEGSFQHRCARAQITDGLKQRHNW